MPGSTESRFGIDDPILPMEAAQKFAELFLIGQRGGRSGAAQLLTTVETLETGDELAPEDAASQSRAARVAAEMPPAGMTQWICGWASRFCPQVWRMLRIPISAPRCLGSAAISRRVAAVAANRRW